MTEGESSSSNGSSGTSGSSSSTTLPPEDLLSTPTDRELANNGPLLQSTPSFSSDTSQIQHGTLSMETTNTTAEPETIVEPDRNRMEAGKEARRDAPSQTAAHPQQTSAPTLRHVVGQSTTKLSDFINDNLIVARYGAISCIGLLTLYGLSQTPLFFRHKSVSELPKRYFSQRRSIPGRLFARSEPSTSSPNNHNVTVYLRHLSLFERWLPQSWLATLLRLHPSQAFLTNKASSQAANQHDTSDLIKVQLVGVQYPSLPPRNSASQIKHQISLPLADVRPSVSLGQDWLHHHVTVQLYVSCQLLGRCVPKHDTLIHLDRTKRAIPGMSDDDVVSPLHRNSNQTAMVKLRFRLQPFQWRSQDVGQYLVRNGYAVVETDGSLYSHHPDREEIVDSTDQPNDLRQDNQYLDNLLQAQQEACRNHLGVWADNEFRSLRQDVVEEVEFQEKATLLQKLWRWLRNR